MALTEAESNALSNRFLAIENKLNQQQTALNNLPTKQQMNATLSIRQNEIIDLRTQFEQLDTTGVINALSEHKIDANAHLELNTRFVLKAGDTMTGLLTLAGDPTNLLHAATKQYVDAFAQGVDWQESALSSGVNDPPGSPTTGDRYVIGPAPTGAWVGQANNIAQYDGSSWDFTVPNEGTAIYIEDTMVLCIFNGTSWVKMGTAINHTNLIGLASDDHPQYFLADGSRDLSGTLSFSNGATLNNYALGSLAIGDSGGTRLQVTPTGVNVTNATLNAGTIATDNITASEAFLINAADATGIKAIQYTTNTFAFVRGDHNGTTVRQWAGLVGGTLRLNLASSGNSGGYWEPGSSLQLNNGTVLTFSGNSQVGVTRDVGLVRHAAGVLRVNDGNIPDSGNAAALIAERITNTEQDSYMQLNASNLTFYANGNNVAAINSNGLIINTNRDIVVDSSNKFRNAADDAWIAMDQPAAGDISVQYGAGSFAWYFDQSASRHVFQTSRLSFPGNAAFIGTTAPLRLGADAAPGTVSAAGDVFIPNNLEVDGVVHFEGGFNVYDSSATFQNTDPGGRAITISNSIFESDIDYTGNTLNLRGSTGVVSVLRETNTAAADVTLRMKTFATGDIASLIANDSGVAELTLTGSSAIKIDTTNTAQPRVGIFQSTPAATLHVSNAITNQGASIFIDGDDGTGDGGGAFNIGYGGSVLWSTFARNDTFGGAPANALHWSTSNFSIANSVMTLTSSGDLGIGTTAPVARLEVEDKGSSGATIVKITADNQDVYGLVIGNDTFSTNDTHGLAMLTNNAGLSSIEASGTGAALNFVVPGNASAIRVRNDGRIGINDTSPNQQLDLVSDFSGVFSARGTVAGDAISQFVHDGVTGTDNVRVILGTNGASGGDPYLQWNISGVQNFSMGIDNSDSDKLKISSGIGVSNANIMTFLTTGEVGIGTTTPPTNVGLTINRASSHLRMISGANVWTIQALNQLEFINGITKYAALTDAGRFIAGSALAINAAAGVESQVGAISTVDGNAGAPGFSFSSDTNTGIYRTAEDSLGFATNGVLRLRIGTNVIVNSSGRLRVPGGSPPLPGVTTEADLTTGLFLGNTNAGFAVDGVARIEATNDGRVYFGDSSSAYDSWNLQTLATPETVGYNGETLFQSTTLPGSGAAAYLFHFKTISAVGSTRADVAIDGRLGIGTSTVPASPLTVVSGGVAATFGDGGGAVGVDFDASRADLKIQGTDALQLTNTQARFNNGSASAPGLTFSSDTATGIFRPTTSTVGITTGGTYTYAFEPNAFSVASSFPGASIRTEVASATNPVFVFNTDINTGLGLAGASQLSLIAGSVEGIRVNAAQIDLNHPTHLNENDLLLAPSVSITGSETGGIAIFKFGTQNRWQFYSGSVIGASTTDVQIRRTPTTVALPVFVPNRSDSDTGMTSVAADTLSLSVGGLEALRLEEDSSVTQAIFPQSNTSATPTIAFGDGDTGFYESSDDVLDVAIGGTIRGRFNTALITSGVGNAASLRTNSSPSATVPGFTFSSDLDTGIGTGGADSLALITGGSTRTTINANGLSMGASGAASLRNLTASATTPTLVPSKADTDTGAGCAADDQLSLIAGGVEGIRIVEDSGSTEVILAPGNAAATTTDLRFGEASNTWIRGSNNGLSFFVNGSSPLFVTSVGLSTSVTGGPGLRNEVSTFNNPTILPDRLDVDTGIGQNANDEISLITGGSERMRLSTGTNFISVPGGSDFEIRRSDGGVRFALDGTTGNIGINNGPTSANLHVNNEVWIIGGSNARFLLGDTTSSGNWGGQRWDSASDHLHLINSGWNTSTGIIELTDSGTAQFNGTPKLPNLTTTERDALTAENGMMIYNTTTSKIQAYAGSVWVDLH